MLTRNAHAVWNDNLKAGNGTMKFGSFEGTYSFASRFENKAGTNPEELIGAAHAGCFSMALSMILGEHDVTPERIDTEAAVTLEQVDDGFAITRVHLTTRVEVSGLDPADFEEAANAAKAGCPVSKLLDAEITMDATLVTD